MTRFLWAWISLVFLAGAAGAGTLATPSGQVLLTIAGQIANTNGDGIAQLDRAMLEALDWREVRTFTSFSDGEQVFEGPTLLSVLEAVGASGEVLEATAINDYSTEIPIVDAKKHDVFLALVWNGQTMRIRNKGPIWVIYPLLENEAAKKPFDGEMIWQLDRITVR